MKKKEIRELIGKFIIWPRYKCKQTKQFVDQKTCKLYQNTTAERPAVVFWYTCVPSQSTLVKIMTGEKGGNYKKKINE